MEDDFCESGGNYPLFAVPLTFTDKDGHTYEVTQLFMSDMTVRWEYS